MINKIVHLSDIHLRKSPSRNIEYKQVFENLYESLRNEKPDRIAIVGDIFHDYISLEPAQLILASNFLINLSNIAQLRVTRGNHDLFLANSNRTDSIEAIVKILNNPNIIYYNKTGFYVDDNIVWCVWHHRDTENKNPWKLKEAKEYIDNYPNHIFIDLYHETINGSKNPNDYHNNSNIFMNKNELKGDLGFLGHIHNMQYL